MPMYRFRTLSVPTIGDGERTSFWLDDWMCRDPLCHNSPALFSLALKSLTLVAVMLQHGIAASLVPQLTIIAEGELADAPLLVVVHLVEELYALSLVRCSKKDSALNVSAIYKLSRLGGVSAPFTSIVWDGFAPSRGKFFAWLLVHSRIQTSSTLLKKHIPTTSQAVCPICGCADESATHIIFRCPFAVAFWDTIGGRFPPVADVRHLHEYAAPAAAGALPASTSTFVILCCWHVWKHRNGVVFQHDTPSLTHLLAACRHDATLWHARASEAARSDTNLWDRCFAPLPYSLFLSFLLPPCIFVVMLAFERFFHE
jgi:hypothetical protein